MVILIRGNHFFKKEPNTMGIIDAIFNKYFGPVFVKESGDAEDFIEKMKSLSAKADGKLKDKIEKEKP